MYVYIYIVYIYIYIHTHTQAHTRKVGFRRVELFEKIGRRDNQFIVAVGKNSNVPSISFYYWFLKTLNTWRLSNTDISVVVSPASAQLDGTCLDVVWT